MPRRPRRLGLDRLEDRTTPASLPYPGFNTSDAVLDPTFGTGGVVEIRPDAPSADAQPAAPKVVGLPGGGAFVLAAFNGQWFVTRLTPAGTPDPAFGTGGRARLVEASIPEVTFTFTDLAVTPDGGVVAVGFSGDFLPSDITTRLLVVKLTAAGQLDTAFNANAAAQPGFGPGAAASAEARGVAVAADGSVYVAGTGYQNPRFTFVLGGVNPARAGVVKFRPDGTPDPTFDGDGAVSFGTETAALGLSPGPAVFPPVAVDVSAADITVDAAGRVFLAGHTAPVSDPTIAVDQVNRGTQAFAARLGANGQLDAAFDADGIVRLAPPPAFPASDPVGRWVVLRPDGTAVVGVLDRGGYTTRLSVAHLTEAGAVDAAFGYGGYALLDDRTGFADLGIGPTGLVAAVTGNDLNRNPAVTQLPPYEAVVFRVTTDGAVSAGERLPVGDASNPVVGAALGVGPDGRVTVAATADRAAGDFIVVARLAEVLATPPVPPPEPPGPVVPVPGPSGFVRLFEGGADGRFSPRGELSPFPGFTGLVQGAAADINGDGLAEYVFVTGPGTPVRFTVVGGPTGSTVLVPPTDPFGGDFTGGGFVAAGDLDGDGRVEIVVTPDQGGGPNVVIYSIGADAALSAPRSFFALGNPAFRGGARPAVGDLNNDGFDDLAVGAGFLGGPNVEVRDGKAVAAGDFTVLLGSGFFAFDGPDATTLRNGVFLAIGDLNGDGFDDLIAGGGPGGSPRVLGLDGRRLAAGDVAGAYASPLVNFFAGRESDRGGVRVTAVDADGDGRAEVVAESSDGPRSYRGRDFAGPGTPPEADPLAPVAG